MRRFFAAIAITVGLLAGLAPMAANASTSAPARACPLSVHGTPGNVSFTLHIVQTCNNQVRARVHCVYATFSKWVVGPSRVSGGTTSKANCGVLTVTLNKWGFQYRPRDLLHAWVYKQLGSR